MSDNCSSTITIPEFIKCIESNAFSNNKFLKSITLPKSLDCICNGAFHNCTSLESIDIPNSVTKIGDGIFVKNETDNRITKIGKFLRSTSLDELPQLWNVLIGEMSLVGFRPPLPLEVEKYHRRHFIRFSTMPGITGIWQVSGRSKLKDFEKIIDMEKKYMLGWNFLEDIIIMFKTVPVVLKADGAA